MCDPTGDEDCFSWTFVAFDKMDDYSQHSSIVCSMQNLGG